MDNNKDFTINLIEIIIWWEDNSILKECHNKWCQWCNKEEPHSNNNPKNNKISVNKLTINIDNKLMNKLTLPICNNKKNNNNNC